MSGADNRGRRSLSAQLSGTLAAAASGGGLTLDAAMRAALAQQPRPGYQQRSGAVPAGAPFAAWAAFNPDRPEETLALFKRLNSRDVKYGEQQALAQRQGVPAPNGDSARHTEADTEANSPLSQDSLLTGTADGSWAGSSGEQGPAERQGSDQQPEQQQQRESQPGQLSSTSPFASAAPSQLPPSLSAPPSVSSRDASPLPPELSNSREELLLRLPAGRSPPRPPPSTASAYYSTGGGGGGGSVSSGGSLAGERWQLHAETSGGGADFDTPRSAVSWVSSSMALPQTEAELAGLEWQEVEQLAAEAAELQQRAALALRLARQRMQGDGGSGGNGGSESGGLESYVPGLVFRPSGRGMGGAGREDGVAVAGSMQSAGLAARSRSAAPASPAADEGPALSLQLPLQLALLLLAAAEAALLFCADLAQRASCGLLRLPRTLVTAPAGAVRAIVLTAVVCAELALRLLTSFWRMPQGVTA